MWLYSCVYNKHFISEKIWGIYSWIKELPCITEFLDEAYRGMSPFFDWDPYR